MSVALEKQESSSDQRSRRSGAREGRRAMRAAPLADDIRPVRAGLEGGSYGPLSQNDQERIHEAVLTLLETVGFANAIPSCIEALTRVGGTYGDDSRIRLPRALVCRSASTAQWAGSPAAASVVSLSEVDPSSSCTSSRRNKRQRISIYPKTTSGDLTMIKMFSPGQH